MSDTTSAGSNMYFKVVEEPMVLYRYISRSVNDEKTFCSYASGWDDAGDGNVQRLVLTKCGKVIRFVQPILLDALGRQKNFMECGCECDKASSFIRLYLCEEHKRLIGIK